ncbi:MAG: tetratricopeptide repeat protein [Myxococcaceae bacterium]|nr:tetratricopeptide repeat protein [Myxococcaceae bacterium]
MRSSLVLVSSAVLVLGVGCAHVKRPVQQVSFDDMVITGDLELDKLNDEELFAAGTSFYAAEDWAQAARYFSRICDFHPKSKHRRLALYNAGLAFEKLKAWDDAYAKFLELSDPKGSGDALDAAFRVAEVLYHLERHADAVEVLRVIADRPDLAVDRRIEARTQQGICELEGGDLDTAERTLRSVLTLYTEHPDKDLIDEYFPGQAQFFVGEIFRLRYESVVLDANKSTEKLAEDLEYKSELLLSSQGHYLRAIRLGNGYWATAAGQRIGQLYENMYDHMANAPAPADLSQEEQDVYRAELRKKIRVLISKAITVYERTLEAAERIGSQSPFVEETRASLKRMKELLLAEAKAEEEAPAPPPPPPPPPAKGRGKGVPHS